MHDVVHQVVTVNKLAEDCVVKIKVSRWCRSVVERNHIEIEHWIGNKKLRVVCVVTGVGHGQLAKSCERE